MMIRHTNEFYINGAWVTPNGKGVVDVLNPATETSIAQLTMGSEDDVDRAVAAAKAAFPSWSETPKAERLALLERVLEVYKRRFGEFAEAITAELGAPKDLSEGAQAAAGIDHLVAFIECFRDFDLEHELPNGDLIVHEAIGVCGLITPWNWPINQIVLKVIPALAAGCTMVLKPSELTPLSAILYAEVLDEAGVPPGVFNLIHGEGPVVGAAMSSHEDIALMSFTGSTRGGVSVATASASTVKKVALELGGKSPNIIFADADLENAIADGVAACFSNTGQSCDAPTRMLVEASVYDRAVEIARETANQTSVGNPTETGDHIGPLSSQMQYDRVQQMIQVGLDEGATLVAGGLGKPEGFETGYYARPTVFSDVTNAMRTAQEEIFGPVLVMIRFETEEEAIDVANDTEYGLSSYLSTGDEGRALRVARKLRAGMVNINGGYQGAGSPFGGYKTSGVGREGGTHGLLEFFETKSLAIG